MRKGRARACVVFGLYHMDMDALYFQHIKKQDDGNLDFSIAVFLRKSDCMYVPLQWSSGVVYQEFAADRRSHDAGASLFRNSKYRSSKTDKYICNCKLSKYIYPDPFLFPCFCTHIIEPVLYAEVVSEQQCFLGVILYSIQNTFSKINRIFKHQLILQCPQTSSSAKKLMFS